MKKLLSYILLALYSASFAQTAKFDQKKFEHLVKTKIDSFRQSKGLNILVNDSVLYVASIDHARYLDRVKKITHYQKTLDKKTPQNRADFYGAINYRVGENIVEVSLLGSEENMAQKMVDSWLNSPGHYANIVTSDYNLTGLAIHYNPNKNSVVAVQKFAIVNEFYVIHQNKELFPFANEIPQKIANQFVKSLPKKHKRHAYGIKTKKKKEICENSNSTVFSNATINLDLRGDSLYIGIKKRALSKVKNYFKKKKDGLTLEFVMFKYNYSCDLRDNTKIPTRRNGRCEFDGPIVEPTYKKNILEQIKSREKYNRLKRIRLHRDECIWVNLGKFPNKVKGEKFEINLLVLKKNRICNIVSALSVCGKPMINSLPKLPYFDNLTPVTYSPKLKPAIKRIRVNFGKNETDNNSTVIEEAINELNLNHHEIFMANIEAFASVEGTLKGNKKLFIKRAEGVLKRFEEHQDSSINYKLKTQENWSMFFNQIDTTNLAYLKELDTLEIRKYVNKNNAQLEHCLSKQRYAYITLYTRPKINNNNLILFAKENFKNIVRFNKFTTTNIKKLTEIQQFLYDKVSKGLLHSDSVFLEYPVEREKLVQVRFNELMFNYRYKKNISDTEMYYQFEAMNKIPHNNEHITFNFKSAFFNARINKGIKKRIDNTSWMISKMQKLNFSEDTIYPFKLHKNHLIINRYYTHQGGRLSPTIKALSFIKKHYDALLDTMSEEFKFKLAKYYVFAKNYHWAMERLKPLAEIPDYKRPVYILYLKVYNNLKAYSPEYYDINLKLTDAVDKLTNDEWCDLFIGMCNINFHIFDDQSLKNLYCSKCRSKLD
mgnify:CR=1 FL=1